MDKVMDHVVETQLKIYNTICYRVWNLCFLGSRQPIKFTSVNSRIGMAVGFLRRFEGLKQRSQEN